MNVKLFLVDTLKFCLTRRIKNRLTSCIILLTFDLIFIISYQTII